MKRVLGFVTAAFLLAAAFLILPIHGEAAVYDSVIRLHVLANSDSEADQALKLTVRDAVLAKTEALLSSVKTREEAEEIIAANLEEIRTVAEETVRQEGRADAVTVAFDEEEYPTREYEALAFPAGKYLSLRVMIGEGAGKNWWCVLFPPLCLSAATAKSDAEAQFLAAGLTDEQYRIITDSGNAKYKLRFKILEVASALFD